MKNKLNYLIPFLFCLIINHTIYSQKIGVIDIDIVTKYRPDYEQIIPKYISEIIKKEKLSAVVYKNGLVWTNKKVTQEDITYVVLQYFKDKEKEIPIVETTKNQDGEKLAIENALKSLRKLKSLTEVGITYLTYNEKLVDANIEIEEYLLEISNLSLKYEISLSLESFIDARELWNYFEQNYTYKTIADSRVGKKYDIDMPKEEPPSEASWRKLWDSLYQGPAINKIWIEAIQHLTYAEKISSEQK